MATLNRRRRCNTAISDSTEGNTTFNERNNSQSSGAARLSELCAEDKAIIESVMSQLEQQAAEKRVLLEEFVMMQEAYEGQLRLLRKHSQDAAYHTRTLRQEFSDSVKQLEKSSRDLKNRSLALSQNSGTSQKCLSTKSSQVPAKQKHLEISQPLRDSQTFDQSVTKAIKYRLPTEDSCSSGKSKRHNKPLKLSDFSASASRREHFIDESIPNTQRSEEVFVQSMNKKPALEIQRRGRAAEDVDNLEVKILGESRIASKKREMSQLKAELQDLATSMRQQPLQQSKRKLMTGEEVLLDLKNISACNSSPTTTEKIQDGSRFVSPNFKTLDSSQNSIDDCQQPSSKTSVVGQSLYESRKPFKFSKISEILFNDQEPNFQNQPQANRVPRQSVNNNFEGSLNYPKQRTNSYRFKKEEFERIQQSKQEGCNKLIVGEQQQRDVSPQMEVLVDQLSETEATELIQLLRRKNSVHSQQKVLENSSYCLPPGKSYRGTASYHVPASSGKIISRSNECSINTQQQSSLKSIQQKPSSLQDKLNRFLTIKQRVLDENEHPEQMIKIGRADEDKDSRRVGIKKELYSEFRETIQDEERLFNNYHTQYCHNSDNFNEILIKDPLVNDQLANKQVGSEKSYPLRSSHDYFKEGIQYNLAPPTNESYISRTSLDFSACNSAHTTAVNLDVNRSKWVIEEKAEKSFHWNDSFSVQPQLYLCNSTLYSTKQFSKMHTTGRSPAVFASKVFKKPQSKHRQPGSSIATGSTSTYLSQKNSSTIISDQENVHPNASCPATTDELMIRYDSLIAEISQKLEAKKHQSKYQREISPVNKKKNHTTSLYSFN